MKKIISLFLALIFVLSMSVSVFAIDWSDITLDYSLTCDGEHSKTVPTDTIITVEYAVKNITNNSGFTVFTTSNEIYYDHHFFELVPDSFELEIDSVTAILQKPEGPNNKIIHEIYMNDQKTQEYQNHQVVGRFKLKVIATSGSSTIKSTETNSYENGTTKYKVADTLSHLTITVGDEGVEPELATITYSFDGTIENLQAAVGEEVAIRVKPDTAPEGKVFDCWKAADGTQYKPGDKYVVKGNETFTAIWKDNTPPETVKYTLTFDSNGGDVIAAVEGVKDTIVNLSSYKPTRSGYEFAGWFSDEALTNKVTSVKLDTNKTVYAKWIKNEPGEGLVSGSGASVPEKETRKYTKDIFGNEHPTHTGYINGYPDGTVKPDGEVTREEITAILYRIMESDKKDSFTATGDAFSDVEATRWSARDIEYMQNEAIVQGYPDGEFKPVKKLTRAEFATLIARFAKLENKWTANTFKDLNDTHWAYDSILALTSSGLVAGYPDETYKPDNNITRAEVMTVINKLLGRKPLESYVVSLKFNPYNDLSEDKWYYVTVLEATLTHEYLLDNAGYECKWEGWK